jgi:hypothetical protein
MFAAQLQQQHQLAPLSHKRNKEKKRNSWEVNSWAQQCCDERLILTAIVPPKHLFDKAK